MNDDDSRKVVEILNNGFIMLSDALHEINHTLGEIHEHLDSIDIELYQIRETMDAELNLRKRGEI